MSKEMMTKAALHKRLTTKPSDERIALILGVLTATPSRLHELRAGLSDAQLDVPLGEGRAQLQARSDAPHLLRRARNRPHLSCAAAEQSHSLPRIHAEREWGVLMRYEAFEIAELMAYFSIPPASAA